MVVYYSARRRFTRGYAPPRYVYTLTCRFILFYFTPSLFC